MVTINKCPICGRKDSLDFTMYESNDPDNWFKDEKFDAIVQLDVVTYDVKCNKCGHNFGVVEKIEVT